MRKHWIPFIFFAIFSTVGSQEKTHYCKTHNNKPGLCMRMRDCELLLHHTKHFTNRLDASKFLRKSQCGLDKYGPLFCCPAEISKNTKRMVFNVIDSTREAQLPVDSNHEAEGRDFPAPTGGGIQAEHQNIHQTPVAWPIYEEHWYGTRVGYSPLAIHSSHPSNGIRCFYHPYLSNPFQTARKSYYCVCYRIKPSLNPPTTVSPIGHTTEVPDSLTLSTVTGEPITSATTGSNACNCSQQLQTTTPATTEKPPFSSTTAEYTYHPPTSVTTEESSSGYPSTTDETPRPSVEYSSTERPSSSSTAEEPNYYSTTVTGEPNNYSTTTEDSVTSSTTARTTTEEQDGFYRRQLPKPPHCGRSKGLTNRIVGGSLSTIGKWPWMVALGYKSTRFPDWELDWACGGALITDRHILTAAHCLERYHPGLTLHVARMGVVDLDKNATAVPVDILVDKKVGHKDFKNRAPYYNDIAILTLKTPAECNDRIHPVCLPFSSELKDEQFAGKHPFIAGWGLLEERASRGSSRMMEVQVPVVNYETCKEDYKAELEVSQQQLCAGTAEKDSCTGDSGGPLVYPKNESYYVIGISSFGKGCARPGYPGVYTRVTAYMDWIKDTLSEL